MPTDVILNLKQVPFKLHGNESKTLRISKESAGEVTAADIEADADVEVLDPTRAYRYRQRGRLARSRNAFEARPWLCFSRSKLR